MSITFPKTFELLTEDAQNEIHTLHPYFASFNPSVPNKLIRLLSNKGDVILDPFCGSGTTLVEAKLLNRHSMGMDANPLACIISKVKTRVIQKARLKECHYLLKNIKSQIDENYRVPAHIHSGQEKRIHHDIPNFKNRDYWFESHVLEELAIIKQQIDKLPNEDLRDFCLVGLSSIIVKVSNQHHETRYSRIDKNVVQYDVYKNFVSKLIRMISSMEHLDHVLNTMNCTVYCDDLRFTSKIKDNNIDLIVTSPPYLNAWDYNLYQRFRLLWLGFDPMELRKLEIGAHLTHYRKSNAIECYLKDMQLCLTNMHGMLKKNGYCCIVIGDSIVKGKVVDTGQLLEQICNEVGFISRKSYRQKILGPHYSRSKNIPMKEETILILEK